MLEQCVDSRQRAFRTIFRRCALFLFPRPFQTCALLPYNPINIDITISLPSRPENMHSKSNVLTWECTVYVLFRTNTVDAVSTTHGCISNAYTRDGGLTFLLSRRSTPSASSREKFGASDFFAGACGSFRRISPPGNKNHICIWFLFPNISVNTFLRM